MKTVTRWIVLHSAKSEPDGWAAEILINEVNAKYEVRRWDQNNRQTVGPVRVEIPIPEKEKSRG